MDRDDLIDELLELQHDLGKYILLPLSFLPASAGEHEVRVALRRALFETHKGPGGVRSARQIWERFESRMSGELEGYSCFESLRSAVMHALAWESRVDDDIDRHAAREDLAGVMPAVRQLVEEVNGVKRDR